MVLYTNDFVALKAHFGPGYLSKALHDVSMRGEHSHVFKILHTEEPIGIRMSKATPIAEESYAQWIVSSITAALKKLFETTTAFLKNVSWKILVEAGKVPDYFEAVLSVLGSLATVSADRLPKYTESIYRRLKDLWDYIKSVVYENLDKKEQEVFVDTREETMNLVNLLYKGSAFIVRKIAAGLAYFLTEFRKYIVSASYEMANGVVALLETAYKESEIYAVKRFVFSSGLKIMTVTQDVISINNKSGMEHRTKAILRLFSDVFQTAVDKLKTETKLDAFITNHWLFKAGYGLVLGATKVASWFLAHLLWLVRVLRVIVTMGFDFISRFTTMLSPLFTEMYDEHMKKTVETTDITKGVTEMAKGIAILEEFKKMDKKNKHYIEHAIETTQNTINNFHLMEERMKEKEELSLKKTNRSFALGSEMLTKLYHNEPVTREDMDELIQSRTGFSSLEEMVDTIDGIQNGLDTMVFLSFHSIVRTVNGSVVNTGKRSTTTAVEIGKPIQQVREELEKVIEDLVDAKRRLPGLEKIQDQEYLDTKKRFGKLQDYYMKVRMEQGERPKDIMTEFLDDVEMINERVLTNHETVETLKQKIDLLNKQRIELQVELDKRRSGIKRNAYITAFFIWGLIGTTTLVMYAYATNTSYTQALGNFASYLAETFIIPPKDPTLAADEAYRNASGWLDKASAFAGAAAVRIKNFTDSAGKITGLASPSFAEALNIHTFMGWALTGYYPYVSSLAVILKFTFITTMRVFGIINHLVMCASYATSRTIAGEFASPELHTTYELAEFPKKLTGNFTNYLIDCIALTTTILSNRAAFLTMGLAALFQAGMFFASPIYSVGKFFVTRSSSITQQEDLIDAREQWRRGEITSEKYALKLEAYKAQTQMIMGASQQASANALNAIGGSMQSMRTRERISTALMHDFQQVSSLFETSNRVYIQCAVCKEHENIEAHCRNCDKMYCAECVGQDVHRL